MDCVTSEMNKFTIKQEKNYKISICGLDTNIKSPCIMCVQYIGGYSAHRGWFRTLGEYHEYIGGVKYIGGYHQCIGEGGYHEYIDDMMMHVGDTMSTMGDVQYIRGYHEYIGVFNRN